MRPMMTLKLAAEGSPARTFESNHYLSSHSVPRVRSMIKTFESNSVQSEILEDNE